MAIFLWFCTALFLFLGAVGIFIFVCRKISPSWLRDANFQAKSGSSFGHLCAWLLGYLSPSSWNERTIPYIILAILNLALALLLSPLTLSFTFNLYFFSF